jgi:phage terminase small subunit
MQIISEKDKIFVLEYLADSKMNPEKAALKVGYSKTMARTKAYLWVSNSKQNPKPQVKELVDEILKIRTEKLELSIQKIENELVKIAFSNIADILKKMDYEIDLKKLKKLSEAEQASICEISTIITDGEERKKIKVHSKLRALELLGKRYKMWVEESEPIQYLITIINNGKPADF